MLRSILEWLRHFNPKLAPQNAPHTAALSVLEMGTYRNYRQFQNERAAKTFLYPYVCLGCRKSFKKTYREQPRSCPNCRGDLIRLSPNFSAPKSNDIKQWEKVAFLISHGFLFHHVYKYKWGGGYVKYPQTLTEAREFVVKYKHWAVKNNT